VAPPEATASDLRGLFAVAGLALLLNVAGTFWGLPARWHPDEKADVVLAMARGRSLAPDSFINPSLPLYAMLPAVGLQARLAEAGLLRGVAADPLLVGRLLSAVAGAMAVLVLGLAVRRHAPSLGLRPPLLLALFPGVINLCHFATPEAWLLLGTVLTLGLCLEHVDGRVGAATLGIALGLTASTKYTAAALAVPALAAVWLRPRDESGGRDRKLLAGAGGAALVLGLALLGPPGAELGKHLHLKDARLLHPEHALGFVRGVARTSSLAGAMLLALAALAAPAVAKAWPRAVPFLRPFGRLARADVVVLGLAAAWGFVLGTPFAVLRPMAFLSDLAYNAQTRVEYKGLSGDATSFLPYAALLGDAATLPILAATAVGLWLAIGEIGRQRKLLVIILALVAPYLLVANSGHRAMRFLAPAWPAAAWLAAVALVSVREYWARRAAEAAVIGRLAVAAVLMVRLFFVDSRLLAARFLEDVVPQGATIDLIANHPGYAPGVPDGRALRIVPTLSREMAPVERFREAAARYPDEASPWLVLTASFYERFLEHPDQQPDRAAFFRDLLEGRGGFEVMGRFRQRGFWRPPNEFLDPEVVVLRNLRLR
jgi:hypothetical protein